MQRPVVHCGIKDTNTWPRNIAKGVVPEDPKRCDAAHGRQVLAPSSSDRFWVSTIEEGRWRELYSLAPCTKHAGCQLPRNITIA